jgi:phage gp36-like protein
MADVVYADRTDLARFGVQASATKNVPDDTLDANLLAASVTMSAHFRGRYSLPLLEWDDSIRMYCCWIAAWLTMTGRGFSQDAGRDEQIQSRYESAIKWCEGVQRQSVHPHVVETPKPVPLYDFPQIASGEKRGW